MKTAAFVLTACILALATDALAQEAPAVAPAAPAAPPSKVIRYTDDALGLSAAVPARFTRIESEDASLTFVSEGDTLAIYAEVTDREHFRATCIARGLWGGDVELVKNANTDVCLYALPAQGKFTAEVWATGHVALAMSSRLDKQGVAHFANAFASTVRIKVTLSQAAQREH